MCAGMAAQNTMACIDEMKGRERVEALGVLTGDPSSACQALSPLVVIIVVIRPSMAKVDSGLGWGMSRMEPQPQSAPNEAGSLNPCRQHPNSPSLLPAETSRTPTSPPKHYIQSSYGRICFTPPTAEPELPGPDLRHRPLSLCVLPRVASAVNLSMPNRATSFHQLALRRRALEPPAWSLERKPTNRPDRPLSMLKA
ncbi:uncharacterized protein K452DRAFT_340473 [Aplosporella prunicola CBS 121167]|uniref:Uncharacterized protein n=1 Tax=Aplosporella prunicola CBS 121167 TaxID=1176127 RepID=A0A6A6BPF8_9PEZI|nr:uncharacterized protein K452DRAFT_340473 [Aplosporella prunicola CBS 121167]KAF2145956.1 hypothetical protein K452DRAFT_340473 [Aplosporella prunicola CBS 121167]